MNETNFKIEKGVPIPPRRQSGGAPMKYPWKDLQIGDSFFVPKQTVHPFSGQANTTGKRFNMKFTLRAENGGVRVWRVK